MKLINSSGTFLSLVRNRTDIKSHDFMEDMNVEWRYYIDKKKRLIYVYLCTQHRPRCHDVIGGNLT
jgi:hypothetical protein